MKEKAVKPLHISSDTEDFEELLAAHRFIHDLQVEIGAALKVQRVSQTELARRLHVSPARISQMLGGNGSNITARTIARIGYVLGLRPCFSLSDEVEEAWRYEITEAAPPSKVKSYTPSAADGVIGSQFEAAASNDPPPAAEEIAA
ncbi:helix-turn-helix transcriptional regulator [Phenylobacterium soli]|uniref:HTH cro/C1-type domain-containing protein n=1 Tax=Phenylobacterium soli TaxID=2170551 RepID=A0A328AAP6_9CAUL|nr:hypothetical protein [Phenylobacterium soli]RAK51762.1 hypothetical protein DJ017_18200 [Phenylobacterium soli]